MVTAVLRDRRPVDLARAADLAAFRALAILCGTSLAGWVLAAWLI